MRAVFCLVLGLFTLGSSRAEASGTQYGPISSGQAAGIVVGIVGAGIAAAFAIHYVATHDRGLEGCVVEADGTKTLVDSNKKVYSLLDGGPSLPTGERVKVRGHTSGSKSAPSIKVEKIIEVYGPCKP